MEQQKNKLNVALFSPNETAYSETFIEAHKENIKENIFYYYGGFIPQFLSGRGQLSEIIKASGFLGKLFSCIREKNKKTNIDILKESLLENKINVVLAEFGTTAAGSLPAIKGASIPLVVHFHGYDAHNNDIINEFADSYKNVFDYASKVLVVSQDMMKQLVKLGCPKEKLIYTVCAPRNDFFDISPKFESQQFLAVGRFVDKKAPYYTILAFKNVLKYFPNSRLKMAADGPLLNMCINVVKFLHIEKNVDFTGVLDRESIKNEMNNSIAFVQHSIIAANGDSEGTPVAIMESGAAGLPVIATRHAGIKDVVLEEETGLLVDEHDVDAMAIAMKRILGDMKFAQQMGQKARERIKNEFSMDQHISVIEKALKESVIMRHE